MTRHTAPWVALLGAALAYEAYTLRQHPDATLSATTRWVFHTHTTAGRAIFIGTTIGVAAWYINHITSADA